MRDIVKMVRFDFVTTKASLLDFWIVLLLACLSVVLMIAPSTAPMFSLAMITVFMPAQNLTTQDAGSKIYGILPVQRSAITRAAFLECSLSALAGELGTLLIAWISTRLELYRLYLSPEETAARTESAFAMPAAYIVIFVLVMLLMPLLRMLCDIFGREHETKIILLVLIALFLAIWFILSQMAEGRLPSPSQLLPATLSGKLLAAAVIHLVMFGLCALFCEITVKKLADREL